MGQDGVINQAKEAKTQSNNKVEEEQMSVKLAQAVGRSDITKDVMLDEIGDLIDTQVIIGNGPWMVKGKSGVPYTVGPDGSVTEMSSEEVGIMETDTIANKKGEVLSKDSIVTIKDSLGNYVRVPKGFKIATESGNDVKDGIVIEDGAGNQFVWVPVGKVKKDANTTVTIPLGRYDGNNGGFSIIEGKDPTPKQDASKGYVYTTKEHGIKHTSPVYTSKFYEFANDAESKNVTGQTYDNTKAKDIKAFVKSANTNGGYYIGRYEAGVENYKKKTNGGEPDVATTNDDKSTDWTGYKPEDKKTLTMVCQKEKQVWNYITQPKAASLCQNMYTTGARVESDLINSYAWDTAIIYIQQCGNNSSTYYSQVGGTNNVKEPVETGKGTLPNGEGTTKEDKQCNIYDMAGNVQEWTTESNALSGNSCARRGGYFDQTTKTARGRDYGTASDISMRVGFRPILYIV